jgi:hypothetical protein
MEPDHRNDNPWCRFSARMLATEAAFGSLEEGIPTFYGPRSTSGDPLARERDRSRRPSAPGEDPLGKASLDARRTGAGRFLSQPRRPRDHAAALAVGFRKERLCTMRWRCRDPIEPGRASNSMGDRFRGFPLKPRMRHRGGAISQRRSRSLGFDWPIGKRGRLKSPASAGRAKGARTAAQCARRWSRRHL